MCIGRIRHLQGRGGGAIAGRVASRSKAAAGPGPPSRRFRTRRTGHGKSRVRPHRPARLPAATVSLHGPAFSSVERRFSSLFQVPSGLDPSPRRCGTAGAGGTSALARATAGEIQVRRRSLRRYSVWSPQCGARAGPEVTRERGYEGGYEGRPRWAVTSYTQKYRHASGDRRAHQHRRGGAGGWRSRVLPVGPPRLRLVVQVDDQGGVATHDSAPPQLPNSARARRFHLLLGTCITVASSSKRSHSGGSIRSGIYSARSLRRRRSSRLAQRPRRRIPGDHSQSASRSGLETESLQKKRPQIGGRSFRAMKALQRTPRCVANSDQWK